MPRNFPPERAFALGKLAERNDGNMVGTPSNSWNTRRDRFLAILGYADLHKTPQSAPKNA
jgi:hypothetical protein